MNFVTFVDKRLYGSIVGSARMGIYYRIMPTCWLKSYCRCWLKSVFIIEIQSKRKLKAILEVIWKLTLHKSIQNEKHSFKNKTLKSLIVYLYVHKKLSIKHFLTILLTPQLILHNYEYWICRKSRK